MIRTSLLLLLTLPLLLLTACKDDTGTDDTGEFTDNWQARNESYFAARMSEARAAIASAQSAYGEAWEDHCDWRVIPTYAKPHTSAMTDSICVKIIDRGTGSGYPLYTDSIKVNYIGRLIPTVSYPEGRIFDHSGVYETEDAIFSPTFSMPSRFAVSNLIEGYTTAVMRMRIGDRWKIYIPQELGYMSATTRIIPAYSTLVFDLQLKGFYRKGETVVKTQ